MRLPSSVALTLSLLTNMAPQFARVATAQAVVLYNDGLAHSSLGAAVGTVDPLLRRYHAGNLGSSGQDGTSIDLPVGGLGCTVAWPNYDAEFSTPGCTHTLELGCTVAGAVRVAAKLTVVRNLDGSENLVSDFSGVHGDNWVALLDGSGATVSMTCCKPTYDVKANKKVAPQYSDYQTTGVPSSAVWATVSSPNSTEQSIEVVYPTAMLVTVDGVTTECRGVRFFRNTGDAVSSIGPFAIKGAWPASAGTGSFTLESEMTDPPCAGLNCPNGPGTSFQALGNARWLTGGGSGAMGIANIGSSGQDGCRESPSRPSLGQTRPPVKALTMVIANPSPASDLNPGLMVWRGEGRSGVNPLYQELCTMTSTLSGGQMHCVPDFSSCGATGYRVLLSQNGSVVADVSNPPDGFTVTTSMPDYEIGLALDAAGEPRIIRNCRTPPCPGEPVLMGLVRYFAKRIEIQATYATGSSIAPVADLSALELRMAGMAPITIIGGNADPATAVTNVDGTPASVDFGRPVLSPNPALGSVHVRFSLPVAAHTRVSVADVLGRKVRALADADFAAGTHDLSWDGHNDAGLRTPAGLYFVRVEIGTSGRVTRLTRLR